MIYALVGHRGVGKTSFLERIREYHERAQLQVLIFDLDQEIVRREGLSIHDIFSQKGEDEFRRIENKILSEILKEVEGFADHTAVFISLGAGFRGALPLHIKVIWITRSTDNRGRIFFDRPRLDSKVSAFEEYLARFESREIRFREIYHKEIPLLEGLDHANSVEPILLGLKPFEIRAGLTVLPHLFQNEVRLEDFLHEKLLLGASFFELRDDLLSRGQIQRLIGELPRSKVLFSFRSRENIAEMNWVQNLRYDWALELGSCPYSNPPILSLHQRFPDESVVEAAERLTSEKAQHYKLAVKVSDWIELWQGHQWYLEDPENRSFLPMSPSGVKEPLWKWYRLVFGPQMKMAFVKDVKGSAFDQPNLAEWIKALQERGSSVQVEFAAVLGSPIEHSRSPAEHSDFFRGLQMPFVALPMDADTLDAMSWSILDRMGLRAAAVTAPLKELVARLVSGGSESVNTLVKDRKTHEWIVGNTDALGFKALIEKIGSPRDAVVWGAGGTRVSLQKVLPHATFYSARTGAPYGDSKEVTGPQVLVWSVGRDRMNQCQWPPKDWQPEQVIDLNYGDDSPGREYALKVKAHYVSGLEMFKAQAAAQRQIWAERLAYRAL